MSDTPLKPNKFLLIKLASIVGHVQEWNSTGGAVSMLAALGNIETPEVKTWMAQMRARGLAPIPRVENK